MDIDRFDSVAHFLTTTGSRRSVGRFLSGFTLTGPLALTGLRSVEATCKKKCGPCKRCKKGKCKPKPAGTVCAGGTCQNGICLPAAGPAPPPPPVTCPTGTSAFAGRCAPNCGETCEAKAGVCAATFDHFPFCAPGIESCAPVPKTCTSHVDCAAQEFCSQIGCVPGVLSMRCVPFLA